MIATPLPLFIVQMYTYLTGRGSLQALLPCGCAMGGRLDLLFWLLRSRRRGGGAKRPEGGRMQVRQGIVKSRLGELLSRRASQKRRDGELLPTGPGGTREGSLSGLSVPW